MIFKIFINLKKFYIIMKIIESWGVHFLIGTSCFSSTFLTPLNNVPMPSILIPQFFANKIIPYNEQGISNKSFFIL